jgi:hypothetical protein
MLIVLWNYPYSEEKIFCVVNSIDFKTGLIHLCLNTRIPDTQIWARHWKGTFTPGL